MALAAISVLRVDLGKNVCSVVGLDASGTVVIRRNMRRETLIALADKLPACFVAMEACRGVSSSRPGVCGTRPHGASDVARICPALHQGSRKNDDRDAEGITEAATGQDHCGSLNSKARISSTYSAFLLSLNPRPGPR